MPYLLQRRFESGGAKAGMVILGILLGLLLTPMFIVAGVLWTLFWIVMELLDLCGCGECDCFSMSPGGAGYYNQNRSDQVQEQNKRLLR